MQWDFVNWGVIFVCVITGVTAVIEGIGSGEGVETIGSVPTLFNTVKGVLTCEAHPASINEMAVSNKSMFSGLDFRFRISFLFTILLPTHGFRYSDQ